MKFPYNIEYVEWLDSSTFRGWIDREESVEDPGTKIQTSGFLYHETENSVFLTSSYDPKNDNVGGFIEIPKVSITSRKIIRRGSA